MDVRPTTSARWLREPLVHFLILGALLFLVFNWRGGGGPGSNRIVITPGQIDSMAAGFARTWQRPPTDQELKGLVDDYVREEMATREAMALGLDRDDTIIRRRLRQKLEFVAEDTIDAAPPTDADLQAWMAQHPETFRVEPQVAFRQVYLSPDKHGSSLEADAERLLAQLTAGGPRVDIETLGDTLMVPREVERTTRADVARLFGEEFAAAVLKVEPGQWTGPLNSGYGLHFVLVSERQEGRTPALAEVRPLVEREFLSARRTRELSQMYERLLERYRVTMEKRPDAAPAATAAPTTPPAGAK
jgi:hypothetical protein